MSNKPQKYPFFTRLKRAWAVYNEYMPTSTGAENGRKKLGQSNQRSMTAITMEKLPSLKLTAEQKVSLGKFADEYFQKKIVRDTATGKPIMKKKHTLVKRKDR